MIRTLSVVSQKGRSGKTTLAVAHGKVGGLPFLIDLDPQLVDGMEAVAAPSRETAGGPRCVP